MKHWHIVIAPMHIIGIGADEMQQHGEVLVFIRNGKTCARFSQYMGWMEMAEETEKPKDLASVLSLVVPSVDPPTPPPGDAA